MDKNLLYSVFDSDGCTTRLGDITKLKSVAHSSSDGNLEKWQVQQDSTGKNFWLKGHSFDYTRAPLFECESECITCRLAKMLGFSNVVWYDMDTFYYSEETIKVCTIPEFDEKSIYYLADLLPGIANLTGFEKYKAVHQLGDQLAKKIQDILLFDILIGNSDRHLHNLAVDVSKNDLLLFDNGASLLSQVPTNRLRINCISFKYHPCRPFFDTVGKQIKLISDCRLKPVKEDDLKDLVKRYIVPKRFKYIWPYLRGNFREVEKYFGASLLL